MYTAQTDIRGIVEKETGEEPFNSPKQLLERAAAKEFGSYVDPDLGTLPVAFISSNVVTNGNSGSAAMNAHGELAGLAFDSNWEGVGSDYYLEFPLSDAIEYEPGELQRFTPTIEALVTPDVDESLDEAPAKTAFWNAFKQVGPWWAALPPY
jgi:hypothetical protein